MNKIPNDMIVGSIHKANGCGLFKIIEYVNHCDIRIEFIATGYKSTVEAGHIRSGSVKDKLYCSVYGIGFVGLGNAKVSVKNTKTKVYATWHEMLRRCYDPKYHNKHPTYKDCTVCVEWHNFQVFAEWFNVNYIDGYELDKDIKVNDNKIYSPKTCMFVSAKNNSIKAKAKHYRFTNPEDQIVDIYNLTEFCRDNNLSDGNMCAVYNGKRKHHKQWRKAA